MSFKSSGEMFLADFLKEKKKTENDKIASTKRIQKKRDEALRLYKETKKQEYADQVNLYDKILDHSEASISGAIHLDRKIA